MVGENKVVKTRRRWIKTTSVTSAALIVMPMAWRKPLINSVLLPAHAMTSQSCGNFIEQPVNDVINIVITATDAQGPISVPLITANFSGEESSVLGACSNGEVQRQDILFSGVIDSVNSQITGALSISIYCGDLLICQQDTTYVADQQPIVNGGDEGAYQGALVGTLSCCEESLNVLSLPVKGRSLTSLQK